MNELNVYVYNINKISEDDIKLIKDKLPKRYEKALKYKKDKDFKRSIGAGILLLNIYNDIDEKEIYYNEFGKPLINNKFFNISHSGDYVCITKDNNLIGIDIQKIDSKNLIVKNRVLTHNELDSIKDNELINFHRLWCVKESIAKAIGCGLNMGFQTININLNEDNTIINNQTFYYKTIVIDDYILAISGINEIDEISVKYI